MTHDNKSYPSTDEQPYPFCEINLSSGHIRRFLPEQPSFLSFLTLLKQLDIPLSMITDKNHIDIIYEDSGKSVDEIRQDIEIGTYTTEEMSELFGFYADPVTGYFLFAKASQVYLDYRAAFARVGLDIDSIKNVAEFTDYSIRYRPEYNVIVTQRLSAKAELTEFERFQLAIIGAKSEDLWKIQNNLAERIADDE